MNVFPILCIFCLNILIILRLRDVMAQRTLRKNRAGLAISTPVSTITNVKMTIMNSSLKSVQVQPNPQANSDGVLESKTTFHRKKAARKVQETRVTVLLVSTSLLRHVKIMSIGCQSRHMSLSRCPS